MPEDKDFKRIVRARMAETGEPYTAARASLRPDRSSGTASPELASFPDIVRLDLAALEAWRRERGRPVPDESQSSSDPHWELTIDAGGRADALGAPELEIATVAALGPAVGGVPYIAFGLHVLLPAPHGSNPDDPGPPPRDSQGASFGALHRAQAHLHQQLREHLGIELSTPISFTAGRVRRQDGDVGLPGRTETTVLLGDGGLGNGSGDRLDPSSWLQLPGGVLGQPWAAYGIVLRIKRDFPTRQFPTDPPPDFPGPYRLGPAVDEELWDRTGEAFRLAAAGVGAPPWPLYKGRLHDPASGTRVERNWQQPV